MSSRREQKEHLKAEREAAAVAEQRAAARRRRNGVLAAVVALAVVVVVVLVAVSQSGDDGGGDGGGDADSSLLQGVPQQEINLGEEDAPVTIVEFADLQCPFCRDFSQDVFPTLVDRYVRSGDLRMELRLLSFIGPDSVRAAEFAAAASVQDLYWSFADVFFANQGTENTGYVTDDFLRDVGEQVEGLDVDQAFEDAGTLPSADLLGEADTLAGDEGVSSTPSFLIGPTGGRLETLEVKALEAGEFEDAIDAQLESAGK